jgi:putative peptidoglycan lipid II flippase
VNALRALVDRFLPRGALLLSALTFGSYAMGLVRDRIFARTYGAGPELDAYNAALVIPELTLDVLVIAGLASAFVPVFSRSDREDPAAARDFASTTLTTAVLLMAIADAILFVIAPLTVTIVAPGFDAAQQAEYTAIFRTTCVTALIFAGSFALGEMLVARQRFLAYGLAPLLYNAGIAGGALLLSGTLGIYGAAVGTVVGAVLHLAVRTWGIRRTDLRLRPRLAYRSSAFLEFVRLALPKMLSQPIEPLTFLTFTAIASTLASGSVSSLSFARNFQSVPVSLIGIAFSVAAFPILSAAAAADDRAAFVRLLRTNVVVIAVLTTGAAIVLYLVAGLAIDLFLGGEAFDSEDVERTSMVLGLFAISVPLESLTHLLARAVYATRNTILPVIASIVGLVGTVAMAVALTPSLGIAALPLAFALGQGVKVAILGVAVVIRTRRIGRTAPVAPTPG